MGDIYAFSANDNNSEFLIESEIEKQLILLTGVEWFHGTLERKDAEKKISTNGEFLVRLSRGNENRFVVSTKWNGKYVHVVIKNDVDIHKKEVIFYIISKFKYNSIAELIKFHKIEQYPLSNTSEAVLYRPVIVTDNNKKEHKFRKSVRMPRKSHIKMLPRSDSETLLASQRFSANFPEINKSLTELPTTINDAPSKPYKPSFRLFSSKLVLPRSRPKNIEIRNEKLFKESGDYSDYSQSRDSVGGLQRERVRRGLSVDVISPSLIGLNHNMTGNSKELGSLHRNDSGGYMSMGLDNTSNCSSDYISPEILANSPSTRLNIMGSSRLPPRRVSAPALVIATASAINATNVLTSTSLILKEFINLNLSVMPLSCCGPIEGAFDTVAINKASSFLLSNPNNSLALCAHLLQELRRIFRIISADITAYKPGYRSLFLEGSSKCQTDLSIRQKALSKFVKATIVTTTSNDRRIQLILFWIKCANHLVTDVRDMFHFRAVITAIFSEQIFNLTVWKTIYRNDPSVRLRMKTLRDLISQGCFSRTDIDQCVPDVVQLYSVFMDNMDGPDQFEDFCTVTDNIAHWTSETFEDPSTWLIKVTKQLDSVTTVPFLRELVQTETLLCLLVGKNSVKYPDLDPLLVKVEDCLTIISDLRNQTKV